MTEESNIDRTAQRELVDRCFEIENAFLTAKSERTDMLKDIKGEMKSRFAETGVEYKEVMRLVKIRLDEQEARATKVALTLDLETYELLYGEDAENDANEDPLG